MTAVHRNGARELQNKVAVAEDGKPARWRRLGRWALVLLVAAYPAFLLVINLALWTGLVETLVSGDRPRVRLRLQHGFAYCVWPTTVHVQDFKLGIDTYAWQMQIDIADGELQTSVLDLMSREFRAEKLRGSGAEIAFALKLESDRDMMHRAEAFRQLEDLPEPVRADSPPPRPAYEDAWIVDLHDVDLHLDRLWIDEIDAKIDGRLRGSLALWGGHWFTFPDSRLDIASGSATLGGEPFADAIVGRLDVSQLPLRPHDDEQDAVPRLSGRVAASVVLASSAWSELYTRGHSIGIDGGGGLLLLDAAVRGGEVMPGSWADLWADRLRIKTDPMELDGHVRVHADVRAHGGDAERSRLHASLALSDVHATRDGHDDPWLTVASVEGPLVLAGTDLAERSMRLVGGNVDLPSIHVHDFGDLRGLSKKIVPHSGVAQGHASAHVPRPSEVAVTFAMDADHLDAELGDTRIEADAYLRGSGKSDFDLRTIELSPLHAKLSNLGLRTKKGRTRGAAVAIDRADVTVGRDKGSGQRTIHADVRGDLDSLDIVLGHTDSDFLERFADNDGSKIAFKGQIDRGPGGTVVRIDRFRGGPVDMIATVATRAPHRRAAIYLTRAKIGVRLSGSNRDIRPAAPDSWYRTQSAWVERLTAGKDDDSNRRN